MGFLQQGGSSGSFNLLSALTKWQGSSSSSGLGLPDLTSLFGATSPKLIFNSHFLRTNPWGNPGGSDLTK